MGLIPRQSREKLWTGGFAGLGLAMLAVLLAGQPPEKVDSTQEHLAQVLNNGVLTVATVNSPVTYYQEHEQLVGFEYELASEFAEFLGVRLDIRVMASFSEVLAAVSSGTVDLAASNITITPERKEQMRFGPPYLEATQYVVYRAGNSKPRSVADLVGRDLSVVSSSSYAETLRQLSTEHAGLKWSESDTDIEQLFYAVDQGQLDMTVADSTILDIHQRFFPHLRQAFALSKTQQVAWAFPREIDDSLLQACRAFFAEAELSGILEGIGNRYHAHIPYFDQINTHYLLRHIKSRLPSLQSIFEEAAARNNFDWRLLAAIGYQESLWDQSAVSPTGVRGIMMMTSATATMMGVEDRADPHQSILGGAAYFRRVKRKLPVRIPEPDRTWLALAAYNIGFAHLEDARILTQRAGMNPDSWADVAEHLPLLNQKEWYLKTRYGYSRGREAVRYVRNIRSFYDILIWVTTSTVKSAATATAP